MISVYFLEQFNRAEFGCVDEYTIGIAKVILNFMDMPVYFLDSRIRWFIPACDEFYISYTLGAKTDRYVKDMTEHMHELGMAHAECETV